MKQFNHTQRAILSFLTNEPHLTGTQLGNFLGVSRSAVGKQIKLMIELGVPILNTPKKGYHLAAFFKPLNEESVRRHLQSLNLHEPMSLHFFATLDSTNRYLKDLAINNAVNVCCSEQQTAGRGRFGRYWHSPFGENIYCSSRWHFNCDLSQLSGLSLVVSLAVIAALESLNLNTPPIDVKWPNDLMCNNKKLCGTLIEIQAESHGSTEVIIGIGLNVNATPIQHPLINKPWCSLFDITGQYLDRNQIIAIILSELNSHLHEFSSHGLALFKSDWQKFDYLRNKPIVVSHPAGTICGVAQGIDDSGHLILIDEQGLEHALSSGDATLKRINAPNDE